MKFKNIILCPSKFGQKKNGVEYFPKLIKQSIKGSYNTVSLDFSNNKCIFDINKFIYKNSIQYDKNIYIGGDHSISIATGAASLHKNKNTRFIWIDAHADINTYNESKTKNYHGMPLAYLTGLDNHYKFHYIKNKLEYKNLCYVGLRDIDSFEYSLIKEKKINHISWQSVNNNFLDSFKLLYKFIDSHPVHISFDVDSINPKYISSTGTPVKDGLEIVQTKNLLNYLFKYTNVIGMDIVEMNMLLNRHEYQKSLKNFKYLFSDIFH